MNAVELLLQWKQSEDLSAVQMVEDLKSVGITMEVTDGRLYVPHGHATPELLDIIASHEADIIEIVKGQSPPEITGTEAINLGADEDVVQLPPQTANKRGHRNAPEQQSE